MEENTCKLYLKVFADTEQNEQNCSNAEYSKFRRACKVLQQSCNENILACYSIAKANVISQLIITTSNFIAI